MRRRNYSRYTEDRPRLRLDRANRKLGGVCAGFANYFDWSRCTVRVMTVVGLFIIPQIILPAYGLAYLIMDDDEVYEDVY